jgi:hypothetical protein
MTMLDAIWAILTFPFRLIGWFVALCGRAVGLVIGFALMVAGVGLCAQQWLPVGLPVLVIGLLLTAKAIG